MLQAHLFRLRGNNVTSNVENSGLTIVAASRHASNLTKLNPAGLTPVFTHLGERGLHGRGEGPIGALEPV